jgi:Putative zinc-finger
MQCETARERLVDGLMGAAPDEARALEEHLASCAACRDERDSLSALWETLGEGGAPVPNAAETSRMRARLEAMLDAYDAGRGKRDGRFWSLYAAQAAVAVVVLAVGFAAGRQTAPASSPDIVTMREELRDLRQMVTLSLMRQQSATDRLKGVSWSGQIDAPSNDIVQALVDTLMHDPSVNVRLASIDALQRFADRDAVRRAALDAVQTQMSPLVQIALIDFVVNAKERTSVPVLKQLAEDPAVHEAVRARASWGLQMLG